MSYRIAIIGAGPAGLSAAARAAALDQEAGRDRPSYVLLEGFEAHAKTIQRYQLGKHVMAEPGFLDLRSDFGFIPGTREAVLEAWQRDLSDHAIHIRLGVEVAAVEGTPGAFEIELRGGETVAADSVILAIGIEGNPRKLGIPGDDLPRVRYHLADPGAFEDETIVVIGAGDSAIENALALSVKNDVLLVNRRDEFSRAKDANLNAVLAAISDRDVPLSCLYSSQARKVVERADADAPLTLSLETPQGVREVACDRVIARLGAIPPRAFVESMGIEFPNDRPDAVPQLSRQYESNVKGIYIIGSLAGYPLIKQAMNQGYDVVEFIHGRDVKPADYPLLAYQFHGLPYEREPEDLLELFQHRIAMFRELNALAFRELVMESKVIVSYPAGELLEEARQKMDALAKRLSQRALTPRMTRVVGEGDVIFDVGQYATSFFTIADGEVRLESPEGRVTLLGRGEFFGEMSLLSGRPRMERAIAGAGCVLVETPRRTMIKLMNSNESVREGIDWIFIVRQLQSHFAPMATVKDLKAVADRTPMRQYRAGDTVYRQGDSGESLHIIRSGGVTLKRHDGESEIVVAQLRSGQRFGEMALMGDSIRRETATATVALETIEVPRREFLSLIGKGETRIAPLQREVTARVTEHAVMEVRPEAGAMMNFLLGEGLGEATDVLVIDEDLCIGCDSCEKACAETHDGISRLDRAAGSTFAHVHVPVACRHCEQPHCMKDCPPNAIQRAADGQVYIDDTCIGCGNCRVNCPYGVIRMAYEAPKKPGLWSWLLFGRGPGPGEAPDYVVTLDARERGEKAMKCDACVSVAGGPACVRACPTGAAIRIGPEQFIDLVGRHR